MKREQGFRNVGVEIRLFIDPSSLYVPTLRSCTHALIWPTFYERRGNRLPSHESGATGKLRKTSTGTRWGAKPEGIVVRYYWKSVLFLYLKPRKIFNFYYSTVRQPCRGPGVSGSPCCFAGKHRCLLIVLHCSSAFKFWSQLKVGKFVLICANGSPE